MAREIRIADDAGRTTGEIVVADVYTEVASGLFAEVDAGVRSHPALADVDGDGDLDLVAGQSDGTLKYYRNTGTAAAPAFAERAGTANPFDGVDVGDHSSPVLADVDGDGDLDLAVGAKDGSLSYYENTGTAAAPTFVERVGTANPFDGVDVGDCSSPALADMDGDGDLDLVTGKSNSDDGDRRNVLTYYEYGNRGTETEPAFGYVRRTGNDDPFDGVVFASAAGRPALVDMDGDGDVDLVVAGRRADTAEYYENTGTAEAPTFTARAGTANPFDGALSVYPAEAHGAYAFGDLDGNGVPDLVVGGPENKFRQFSPRVEKVVTWTFDADGVRTGHTEDRDGDGNADSVVTHTFDETGRRTGHVRTDVSDVDGDGNADRTVTATFDANGEKTGSAQTDVSDVDGDGNADRTVTATFDADGEKTGSVQIDVSDSDGDGNADRTETRTFDANGDPIGRVDVVDFGFGYGKMSGSADPFDGVDVGDDGAPALVDLDGDGDLDLVAGEGDGFLNWYENTGTARTPTFVERGGTANPFDGIDKGKDSAPALADLDGDGDLDLLAGDSRGQLHHHLNAGTASEPTIAGSTAGISTSPGSTVNHGSLGELLLGLLGGSKSGSDTAVGGLDDVNRDDAGVDFSAPALADLDGDGLVDLVFGESDGTLNYYRNTGTASAPEFTEIVGTANPFDGVDVGDRSAPALGDVDLDGDLDLVVGESDGTLNYHENTGTATAPTFVARVGTANPFDGLDVGDDGKPFLADVNGDGAIDLVVGKSGGTFQYFARSPRTTVVFDFDADGETIGRTRTDEVDRDGDGNVDRTVTVTFDADGEKTGRTQTDVADVDGDGDVDRTVVATFDADGQKTGSVQIDAVDADGDGDVDRIVTQTFDGTGLRTGQTWTVSRDTDGDGVVDRIVIHAYDENGRPTGVTHDTDGDGAADRTVSHTYDENGRRSVDAYDVDGDGVVDRTIAYAHDEHGRRTAATYNTTGADAADRTVSYTHNEAGRRIAAAHDTDGDGVVDWTKTYAYDEYGRRSVVAHDTDGDGVADRTETYAYGADGRRSGHTLSANNAPDLIVTYAYDADGLRIGHTEDGGGVGVVNLIVTYIYDENGLQTGYTGDANGDGRADRVVTHDLDVDGEIVGRTRTDFIDKHNDGYVDRIQTTTYDAVGRHTSYREDLNGDGRFDWAETYGYDEIGRQVVYNEDSDNDGVADRTETWDFDADGEKIDFVRTDFEDRNGDGVVDRTEMWNLDANRRKTGGTRTDVEDRDGDGTMDRTETWNLDANGRKTGGTRIDVEDRDGDGTVDRTETWNLDANGRKTGGTRIDVEDTDGDGTADRTETVTFDGDDRRIGAVEDRDGDGTADRTETYAYDESGRQTGYTTIGSGYARSAVNPFDGIDVGARSAPTLADVDGDGDFDLVTGEYDGVLNCHENVGTAQAPEFVVLRGDANPFDGIDVGARSVPVLVDMDGDGDLDLVVGDDDGTLNHHENVGTAQTPVFVARVGTANPFDGIDVGRRCAPTLADLDDDGDHDLTVGEKDGTLRHYENVGTARTPAFVLREGTEDPFDGLVVGHRVRGNTPVPVLADTDGDGDFDLTVGERTGILHHHENVGTAAAPKFVARGAEANPFSDVDAGSHGAPALADLDGDGILDLAVGSREGRVECFTVSSPKTVTYTFDGEGVRTGHVMDMDGDGNPDEVAIWTFDESGRRTGYVLHGFEYDAGRDAPLRNVEMGHRSAPALADLDGDGDLDLAVGEHGGGLAWHENVGTARAPEFAARGDGDDPFKGVDAGPGSAPAFADLDGDGDLDLVLGNGNGTLNHFENVGTAQAPEFAVRDDGDDPFEGVDVGRRSSPSLGDLDGDGDLDLVVGDRSGGVNWYENVGTARTPEFAVRVGDANPFRGVDVGGWSSPVLGDADGDGDLDLTVGGHLGGLTWHENVGTAQAPEFAARDGAADPFDGVRASSFAMPALADLNGDGMLDLLVGKAWGGLGWFMRRAAETVVFDFDEDGERSGRAMDTDGDGVMDVFEGDDGDDVLTGGAGADVLVGFRGSDSLSGGGGEDTFVFRRGDGRDTIGDFEKGSDRIEFVGGVVVSFADLTISASGSDATVGYGRGGDLIVLTDVSAAGLTSEDFLFG